MSEWLSAIALGIIEGLTEFIPVSSTGHMILLGHVLGFEGEKAKSFEIFIQLGAILAIFILYFPRFKALLDFSGKSGNFSGISGLSKLAVASLPIVLMGAAFGSKIKEHFFQPGTVAAALILGGIVMICIERNKTQEVSYSLETLSLKTCLLIGVFQCFALWPGMSRSASCIVGGLLLGVPRILAAEFSFLVAVPVMCIASAYQLYKGAGILSGSDLGLFGLGFVVAFIVAIFAVKFFLTLLRNWTLKPFGIYRIALGILVFVLLMSNSLGDSGSYAPDNSVDQDVGSHR